MKNENHGRELSTLRKSLADAESTIRRLEWQSVKSRANTTRNADGTSSGGETRRLEAEVRGLRAENEKLEEKLRVSPFLTYPNFPTRTEQKILVCPTGSKDWTKTRGFRETICLLSRPKTLV